MSVLACNREGCNEIMCDRISHEFGYICNDCFEELVNILLCCKREEDLRCFVKKFMKSDKSERKFPKMDAHTFADELFPYQFPYR